MAGYTLKDIQAATPGYPTAALERRVHLPCSVKLVFVPDPPERGYPEALWVTVTAMANGTYTGTLADQPNASKDLPRCGDLVMFQGRHIVTVMPSVHRPG